MASSASFMRRSLFLFFGLFRGLPWALEFRTCHGAICLTWQRHGNEILSNGVHRKPASFATAVKEPHVLCVVEGHKGMFQTFTARESTCVLENYRIYFVFSMLWLGLKTIEICNCRCKLDVAFRALGCYESFKVSCGCWRLCLASGFGKLRRDSKRERLRGKRIRQNPRR